MTSNECTCFGIRYKSLTQILQPPDCCSGLDGVRWAALTTCLTGSRVIHLPRWMPEWYNSTLWRRISMVSSPAFVQCLYTTGRYLWWVEDERWKRLNIYSLKPPTRRIWTITPTSFMQQTSIETIDGMVGRRELGKLNLFYDNEIVGKAFHFLNPLRYISC